MNNVTPKKPFDITKHEFSCDVFYSANLRNNVIELEGDYCVNYTIDKADLIAMCKALGVTGDDL